MSEALSLDLREQIARIDRNQAELQKLFVETVKLQTEHLKLEAEQLKLRAETRKLNRDRIVQTALAFAAILGGALSVVQLLTHVRPGG